jgi:uncharacterized protein YbjQ (UPF0145 family)
MSIRLLRDGIHLVPLLQSEGRKVTVIEEVSEFYDKGKTVKEERDLVLQRVLERAEKLGANAFITVNDTSKLLADRRSGWIVSGNAVLITDTESE